MPALKRIVKKIPGLTAGGRRLYRTGTNLRNFLLYRIVYRHRSMLVPVGAILIGQQSGYPLKEWVEKTGEYERVSLPIDRSPYAVFLRNILTDRKRLGDEGFLRRHKYFRMAKIAIRHAGHFMGARSDDEIFRVMRDYFDFYLQTAGEKNRVFSPLTGRGHSLPETPIILSKIKYSDSYEVVDGHHRIAAAAVLGREMIRATIAGERTSYLQDLVLSGRQTHGDRELYQPLPQPEVKDWPLVRLCRDRWEMMMDFFRRADIEPAGLTLLDCSCSYGWFLQAFKRSGMTVLGIDRDPVPVRIGRIAYALTEAEITEENLVNFLERERGTYDIVLFLSILHHFALGREKGEVSEILRRLDAVTGRVLFLDTGQNHEKWWRDTLPQWDDAFISHTILSNTSFRQVVKLGEDRDNRGSYEHQYRRSLFACLR